MKRLYVTAVIAGAMFFSVESATAQETNQNNQSQTATEQTQQKDDFEQIQEQDLPNEVRQAVERDHQGATFSEVYVSEKDGEKKYKLVLSTQNGESQELYADAQGNWIDKENQGQGME